MGEDAFRWCVYCKADCWPDPEDQQHAEDCPVVTGVFPTRQEDLGPACPQCGYQHGMRCTRCMAEFKVGDFYMHHEVDPGDSLVPGVAGAAVYEVICVGCAAKEAVL